MTRKDKRLTQAEWKQALDRLASGSWQKEVPSEAGRYMTSTAYGDRGDIISVYIHPQTGVPTPVKQWGGFWWGAPIPDPPEVSEELIGLYRLV